MVVDFVVHVCVIVIVDADIVADIALDVGDTMVVGVVDIVAFCYIFYPTAVLVFDNALKSV